jgi:hypothetical protein
LGDNGSGHIGVWSRPPEVSSSGTQCRENGHSELLFSAVPRALRNFGCYTAIGHHVVGEAEPGQYVFRVEPNVIVIDGAHATLPRLSRTLVVE